MREKHHRGQKYAASLLITSVQVVNMSYDQHLARLRFKFVVCFEVLIMWVHTRINTIFSCFFENEVFALKCVLAYIGQGRDTLPFIHVCIQASGFTLYYI